MRLTLNPNWRPRPLRSFLGFMDIKTGVTIALLFAVSFDMNVGALLFNKVAGVYGLIAVFTGGSLAQLSMYIYSLFALVALTWGLKAVGQEDPKRVLYFAHMFFLDHLFSTCWTVFFGVVWWVYTPHDGRQVINSDAQRAMMGGASGEEGHNMTETERAQAALGIWNKEKGFAAAVLIIGWLIKIYFAVLIYSYAYHLRKGSYRTLPQPFTTVTSRTYGPFPGGMLDDDDDDQAEPESFYRPNHPSHVSHSSVASWSDFVSAPGKKKRFSHKAVSSGSSKLEEDDLVEEEVLFDEDELVGGTGSSGQSKMGTEETTSVSTNGEDERDTHGGNWGNRSRT
ncbi:DUF1753-domain-containing protein [Ramaria rubella]|nr:DUF1753-domain-containing protein [Ramaria rubella]